MVENGNQESESIENSLSWPVSILIVRTICNPLLRISMENLRGDRGEYVKIWGKNVDFQGGLCKNKENFQKFQGGHHKFEGKQPPKIDILNIFFSLWKSEIKVIWETFSYIRNDLQSPEFL